MKITYQTKTLKKICKDTKFATRRLGPNNAAKLQLHLEDIDATDNVTEIVLGNPHSLKGDRKGQYSISLAGGTRLVFKPNHDVVPRKKDGGIDWKAVTAVTICFIGDYHD